MSIFRIKFYGPDLASDPPGSHGRPAHEFFYSAGDAPVEITLLETVAVKTIVVVPEISTGTGHHLAEDMKTDLPRAPYIVAGMLSTIDFTPSKRHPADMLGMAQRIIDAVLGKEYPR